MFRHFTSPLTVCATVATLGLTAVAVGPPPTSSQDRVDSIASVAYVTSSISAAFADATILTTQRATLSGVVSPGAGRVVTFQKYYSSAWHSFANTVSAADGRYSYTLPAQSRGEYTIRAVAYSTPTAPSAYSAGRTLQVASQTKVSASLDVAAVLANSGTTATLAGSVYNTDLLSRTITLQRLDGTSWTDVTSATSSSTGAYAFTLPQVPGATTYRAWVPGVFLATAANSAGQTLTVTDQTKVSASLNVAAVLANSGMTAKISGSVYNTDLLSRTTTLQRLDGTSWTNLTSGTSSSTGAYAFTLPQVLGATTYRVSVPEVALATAANSASQTLTVTEGDSSVLPNWGAPSWRDEFNGSAVDTTNWKVQDKTYISYDKASLYAKQCTVANGVLRMRAERADPATDLFGRSYASCYITSQGKFAQRYGRFEMRAKLPTTPNVSAGLWPSFWLRDGQGSGEIDIMESWGTTSIRPTQDKPENYSWTVHADTNSGTSGVTTRVGGDGRPKGAAPITTAYHRYAAEWTPDAITFYFDDEVVGKVTSAQNPWLVSSFPSSANIRLHYAVGGAYWGEPNANTLFPADYMVDYVRVWARP